MIKLIASDMDGTLLNDKMAVSDRNIQAIKDAQKNGIEFIIATGRSLDEAKPFLKNRVHPGYITLNGAEVYDENEKLISSNPISEKSKTEVINYLKEHKIYFEVVTNKGIFSDNKDLRVSSLAELLVKLNPSTTYEQALQDTLARVKLTPMNFVDSYDKILNDPSYKVMKLLAFSGKDTEVLVPLRKDIEKNIDDVVVTSSSPNNVEINSIDAQKGIALLQFAKDKNISQEETMAIGDNLNDESMIRDAGVGVAMKNAIPAIAKLAQIQTDNNVNDGVAQIVEKVIAKAKNQNK
ncbi:Cof-type HAD-IIB family hydrolase [Companilactobacillus kimchii]|uniref:HAD superfamily hydrolase n=2 Tax=Companilactobacillus kimchii TaxID=2801452 RepID=A0ABR5NQZ2_9LACO|nr:Cof-type HAD-IIB family hydrolase [Companilactobacillus kimchii]GEO47816.1 haloacid dehalogenase [Companilactobacillus paralimentarius]KAE9559147.1 haloacid dehalogenase [Companilactobacillus kimchii]KAE9560929.1 haloacid dehalogenase [Companilactobacillus kimchii]KRK50090.1 HAD superfamily hydrolase [Companilactobacillus kimchii DSM 13961 = JCM 10707]OWF32265.1 putative phosphatase YcsE [Companilactobacillus kimchii]